MTKQKTKTTGEKVPRDLKSSAYRYTVDEFLTVLVNCDEVVLFYDTCNMCEYRYTKTAVAFEDAEQYSNDDTTLDSIFGAFAVDEDKYLEHRADYWKCLVPGGDLLEFFVHHEDQAMEYATTKLNTPRSQRVYMDCVSLVHSIPVGAVHKWLKFVGRQFSEIPRGNNIKHKPFRTTFM